MKAQDFSHDWDNYVTIKVKSIRAVALSGLHTFTEDNYSVPQAVGFIELLGSRAGALRTALRIGFSKESDLPPPSFELYESIALGTLTLPADCFSAISSSSTALRRISASAATAASMPWPQRRPCSKAACRSQPQLHPEQALTSGQPTCSGRPAGARL